MAEPLMDTTSVGIVVMVFFPMFYMFLEIAFFVRSVHRMLVF